MGHQTVLYSRHVEAGARIVDFGGWDMPVQYQSLMDEHHAVRQHAGMFDVSHMTILDVSGPDAERWLRYLLANDVARMQVGQALYSAMLNHEGGVVDDLILYRRPDASYRLITNCATRAKDLAWMETHRAGYDIDITEQTGLAIIAVQGPAALTTVTELLARRGATAEAAELAKLKPFFSLEFGSWFLSRTGYTGENGLEILLPNDDAPALWDDLVAAGVQPVGLGARDTLRLEAGLNLYGHEMDETVSPLSANMGWTIAWEPADRDFIGRTAVEQARQAFADGQLPVLAGLVLEERGVLREGLRVECTLSDGSRVDGVLTSGTFSPTLKHSIALARIPADAQSCAVEMRGKLVPVRRVQPGFVRQGKRIFT